TTSGSINMGVGAGGSFAEAAGAKMSSSNGVFVTAQSNGTITVNGAVTAGSSTQFITGPGGSFTQGSAATIAVTNNNSQLLISADALALNGAAGSISGAGSGSVVLETAQS